MLRNCSVVTTEKGQEMVTTLSYEEHHIMTGQFIWDDKTERSLQ